MSYVKGKWANAAVDLMDYLGDLGVRARVGYAEEWRLRNNTIHVYLEGPIPKGVKIPEEWWGMRVEIVEESP